jgi:hypothetical protein
VPSWAWRVLWLAFVVAGASPWLLALTTVDLSWLYANLCHQEVARSLAIDGHTMVVCSRCAGIYLGLVFGALLAGFSRTHAWWRRHGRHLVIAAIVANVADWMWSTWMPLSHLSRIGVGALFGATGSAFMLAALYSSGDSAGGSTGASSAGSTKAGAILKRSAADT